MATINPIQESIGGTSVNGTAASAGGDRFPNPKGNVRIFVRNGGGASINVTLDTPAGVVRPADSQFPAMPLGDQVVAIPAGEAKMIGPVPSAFNTDGDVSVGYSAVTSVTVWSLVV